MLLKMCGYAKGFDKTNCMPFLVKYEQLFKNTIKLETNSAIV